jgi:hypothetical protein
MMTLAGSTSGPGQDIASRRTAPGHGLEEYEAAMRQRMERALRKKARALGYDLVLQGPVDGCPALE